MRKPAARRVRALRPARAAAAPAAQDPSAPLAAAFGWHAAWRDRLTILAQDQLAFASAAADGMVALGQAMAAEPDPFRRGEMAWSEARRQVERGLDLAVRAIERLAGIDVDGPSRR